MTFRTTFISRAIAVAFCACALYSCAAPLPVPTTAHAEWAAQRWPGTDTTALQHGRTLYIGKCAGCHNLYTPDSFSEQKWTDIMPKMQKKAKIADSEADLILHYVLAAASVKPLRDSADTRTH